MWITRDDRFATRSVHQREEVERFAGQVAQLAAVETLNTGPLCAHCSSGCRIRCICNRAARPLADLQRRGSACISACQSRGLMNLGMCCGLRCSDDAGLRWPAPAVDAGACTFHGSRRLGRIGRDIAGMFRGERPMVKAWLFAAIEACCCSLCCSRRSPVPRGFLWQGRPPRPLREVHIVADAVRRC